MDLINQLKEKQIVKHGSFTLKSGATSDVYFNFKQLIAHPTLMTSVCYALTKLIIKPVTLCGVPMGAIAPATIMSYITSLPMVLVRDDAKEYGLQNQIEGVITPEVILVEDVITTAGSVLKCIDVLNKHNIHVIQIIAILDRQAGGVSLLQQQGYQVNCLYNMGDFSTTITTPLMVKTCPIGEQLLLLSKQKQSKIILSADGDDLYNIIDVCGPHVCAVKLHADLFNDFDIDQLLLLKQKHQLLYIEDRKLSDIAYIGLKQIQKIKQYADMVTVHGMCGKSLVQAIGKEIGVLIVHTMTTNDHLMDTLYQHRVSDMTCDNLVGYVSPNKVKDYLTLTTGINLSQTNDNMNQCYKTHSDGDLFIVGRGIYDGDSLQNVKRYQHYYNTLV